MRLVLVLIAEPGALAEADARRTAAILTPLRKAPPRWLSPNEACEFDVAADDDAHAAELRARLVGARADGLFAGRPIDTALVAGENRRKKLLVADMESTIIREELLDELAGLVGLREKIAAITDRAMRGASVFEPELRDRVALLAGLATDSLDHVMEKRMTLMPGARTLVRTMRTAGAYTALVSGGFSVFVARVAERVGFDAWRANTLEVAQGRLTGRVVEPILGQEAKLDALRGERDRLGLNPMETLAVGDGANDRAMIRAAGLGVAFRAKPALAAEADASIIHGDLTALLYLQGFRRDEFVR